MSVLVSHMVGNPNLRGVLTALAEAGELDSFWTTLAMPRWLAGSRLIGEPGRRVLGKRAFPEAGRAPVRARPLREATRLMARRFGLRGLIRHETGWACDDRIWHALDRAVAAHLRSRSRPPAAIWAYDDGAEESFRAAGERGIARIFDLPITYWRNLNAILAEEAERHPAWAASLPALKNSAAKLARKDRELAGADRIVVASSHTRASLADYPARLAPVEVLPYGAPAPRVARPAERAAGQPLKLLFAGRLDQRKGLADLIDALGRLAISWELTLCGSRPVEAPQALDRLLQDGRCRWLGQIPHATLLEEMTRAHVFVFPSIAEGFGLVITEAMACGLAVVTTPNTCGPDMLADGREGHILPIRAPEALAERLTALYEDEPARQAIAAAALERAGRSGWEHYHAGVRAIAARACEGGEREEARAS